jgi:glycosyltransferase involved in cell wall biosynthesis
MRGGEKVLEVLLDLLPGAPIYTLFHLPGSVSASIEERPIETSFLQRAPGLRGNYRYYLPLFPRAVESLRLPETDLVVSSSHCVAKGVLKPAGARHVCYCHTPVRYAWDQRDAYFSGGGPMSALRGRLLDRLRRWDAATAGRVDQYVANSHFVADRIRRYYERDATVVPPPVDTEFYRPADTPRADFCLYVSALAPYKRIDLAAEACRRLGRRLLVVGDGPERARLEQLDIPGLELLGRVSAVELRELYRTAHCFVQPGIEDFGISAAEALSCGCPVVAVGEGGVLDIVESGRDGVLYPSEAGVDGLVASIDKIRKLRFNSLDLRQNAERFAVEHCRERLRQVLST